jgi:hypothetical protein
MVVYKSDNLLEWRFSFIMKVRVSYKIAHWFIDYTVFIFFNYEIYSVKRNKGAWLCSLEYL